MKTIRLILISVLLALASQSVNAQSLVGTWKFSQTGDDGTSTTITLTFNEDKTFSRDTVEPYYDFKNQTITVYTHVAGKWKLIMGGRRLYMRVIPSSVTVNTEEGSESVAKILKASIKADGASSRYMPKIVSVSETELVLAESVEDDVKGSDPEVDYTHMENFTYVRQ